MESSYIVKFTNAGVRRIRKLDKSIAKRILNKVVVLEHFKNINNIKQMKGGDKVMYRWRLGDLRVIFEVEEKTKVVWIVDMDFRGSVYNR